jgi:hypothetical protein
MSGEKRFITGTNPRHNHEVPDGMLNSLVDKNGSNVDTSWNFDEWDDDKGELESSDIDKTDANKSGWDEIAENS